MLAIRAEGQSQKVGLLRLLAPKALVWKNHEARSSRRFKIVSDCFSPEVYAPKNRLCKRTANRPSGEIAAAVGKLFVGCGSPGTSPSSFPLGNRVGAA